MPLRNLAMHDFFHNLGNACLHLLGDQVYNGQMKRLISLRILILAFLAAMALDGLNWLSI